MLMVHFREISKRRRIYMYSFRDTGDPGFPPSVSYDSTNEKMFLLYEGQELQLITLEKTSCLLSSTSTAMHINTGTHTI